MALLHSHSRLHMYSSVLVGLTGRVERLMHDGQFALVSLCAAEHDIQILDGARRLVLHVEGPEGSCSSAVG
ncbi:hypothetical protein HNP84_009343 [Thermocatellispora tengchongensis]|uniref:Uncharacterized protein n=1 Tax=Thermocatellispora tengchongensis TaxID=1073253 RepID=A0A840PPD6_9ACTN|nr:hypothetical protein [Thermocatellispora tengchongensis]MBB5139580.1 hypothetical protein [Thermocatellispora tengchongensis]